MHSIKMHIDFQFKAVLIHFYYLWEKELDTNMSSQHEGKVRLFMKLMKENIVYTVVTLLFGHLSSRASEVEHFEIFNRWQENQLAQHFSLKFNLLLLFLIS